MSVDQTQNNPRGAGKTNPRPAYGGPSSPRRWLTVVSAAVVVSMTLLFPLTQASGQGVGTNTPGTCSDHDIDGSDHGDADDSDHPDADDSDHHHTDGADHLAAGPEHDSDCADNHGTEGSTHDSDCANRGDTGGT